MSIRIDKLTGKVYSWHNIPLIDGTSSSRETAKGYFVIQAQNHSHPDDSWYNGRFIGDHWAVFQWIPINCKQGYFKQVSNWYSKYGNALRKLNNLV